MDMFETTLQALRLGCPRTYEGLTLFPVFGPVPKTAPAYRLLEAALADGEVEITEVSEGGHVPELRLVNRGQLPVLLLDGEELVGAKQNRVLNLTVLAPPGETRLPVSCVEAGRWAWRERGFRAAGRTQFAEARAEKLSQVARNRRHQPESACADQHAVWHSIARKAARLGVRSETEAMADLFEHHARDLDAYVEALGAVPEQTGALFARGDRITGFDFFDHPDTLVHSLPKLVRSQALDAIEHRAGKHRQRGFADPWHFLGQLARCQATAYPTPGLGEDLRLEGEGVQGAALAWEGRLIHLVAFAQPDRKQSQSGPDPVIWY